MSVGNNPVYITTKYFELEATSIDQVPYRQTKEAAMADLVAAETVEILPGGTELIETGIKILSTTALPPFLASIRIYPRSSLACKKNLIMPNSTGIIDADYRETIKVPMMNIGTEKHIIHKGERIAQMEEVAGLNGFPCLAVDRKGGFGSSGTGVKKKAKTAKEFDERIDDEGLFDLVEEKDVRQ